MAVLNRCAVAVYPRQPMLTWSRTYWTREDREGLNIDQSVYLIPTFNNREEAMDLLEQLYAPIFLAELDLWCHDQSQWPDPRSFELFQQWFALSFYNLVEDLGSSPLRTYHVDGDVTDLLQQVPNSN
jgi:hypothetical protein